jgi:hypothetical protein
MSNFFFLSFMDWVEVFVLTFPAKIKAKGILFAPPKTKFLRQVIIHSYLNLNQGNNLEFSLKIRLAAHHAMFFSPAAVSRVA